MNPLAGKYGKTIGQVLDRLRGRHVARESVAGAFAACSWHLLQALMLMCTSHVFERLSIPPRPYSCHFPLLDCSWSFTSPISSLTWRSSTSSCCWEEGTSTRWEPAREHREGQDTSGQRCTPLYRCSAHCLVFCGIDC